MLRTKNIVQVLALSTVMFGAGVTVATVALSYLPMVNASSTSIAQGIKQSKAEEVDEENNIKYRFQDCKRTGKTVVCSVLATNLKTENQKIFYQGGGGAASRVIDVDGNQYAGRQIVDGKPQDAGWVTTSLIYNVPTRISFSYEIPREVTKLAALELSYRYPYDAPSTSKPNTIQLRNLSIGASQASNPGKSDCTPAPTNPKKPRGR
ncbi:hypothetical protein NIES4071_107620 (plasmid) [Calothrix sp. NIES-4071]|nr:hypothetical protein NIES4071_107620 [Calothrix sp. NIES-4071]BAZ64802.1 hypothetical protein NIES4105_105350 [Calothrix sp. NIES-4105]